MMFGRDALPRQLQRVRVAQLVRGEALSDARLSGEPAELRANRGGPTMVVRGGSMMQNSVPTGRKLSPWGR